MEGSFTIKKIINNRAFYAQVDLAVETTRYVRVVDLDMGGFTRWKGAAAFAAEYFFDHYQVTEKGGLKIAIAYIHDMEPYDTNNMVVFYAVVHALCKAFGIPCDLNIDNSGAFVIPR